MLVSFFVSFFAVLFTHFEEGKRFVIKHGMMFGFFLLFLFMSFRYNFGNDYTSYLSMFYDVADGNFINERVESGWILLYKLFFPIGFFGFIILTSFLYCFVFYRTIRSYVPKYFWWISVFFLVFNASHLILGLSMMRQFMAMVLFLLSTILIIRGNFFLYVVSIILISQIHSSAILLLPMYFLRYKNISYPAYLIVFLLIFYVLWFFLAYYLMGGVLNQVVQLLKLDKYEGYIVGEQARYAISLPIDLLVYMYIMKYYHRQNSLYKLFFNLIIVGLYLSPIVSLAPGMGRLIFYFSLFSIFVYPKIYQCINNSFERFIFLFLLITLTVYRFFLFFINPIWYETVYKYHTIFEAPNWM